MHPQKETIFSPASTAPLAEAVAVIRVVTAVATLVTPIIGIKLSSARAPTALSGHACGHFNPNTGTTKESKKEKDKQENRMGEEFLQLFSNWKKHLEKMTHF